MNEDRAHMKCWDGEQYAHICQEPSGRKCIEGCGRPAGTWWGTHFCPECDVRRLDGISASLEGITATFRVGAK